MIQKSMETASNQFVTNPERLINNLSFSHIRENQLFVSTYMLHLPDKKKLQEFVLKEMKEMGI